MSILLQSSAAEQEKKVKNGTRIASYCSNFLCYADADTAVAVTTSSRQVPHSNALLVANTKACELAVIELSLSASVLCASTSHF